MMLPATVTERVIEESADGGFWVGAWKNVAIQLWAGETTVVRLDRCADCHRRVLRAYPNKLVTFAVIMPGVPPRLGDAERKRIKAMSDEQESATVAAVQVVEGSGFWASAVRAVLIGLGMFTVTRNKVFQTIPDAVHWVMATGMVEGTALELRNAIEEGRRALGDASRAR
jgi:hypothetical protein